MRHISWTVKLFLFSIFLIAPVSASKGAPPEPVKVDAAVYANGRTYFFVKYAYYRLLGRTVEEGYPKTLNNWKGLPNSFLTGIDAAFFNPENKRIYMLKGSQYVRIQGTTVEKGYPRSIANSFTGMPSEFHSEIDSAIFYNGHVYFFKGKKYVRLTDSKMDSNYPAWQNAPNAWEIPASFYGKIDASFYRGDNDRNYFFSGQESQRFIETRADGVPQPLTVWQGLTDSKRFVTKTTKINAVASMALLNNFFKDTKLKLNNYNGDHHISMASQLVLPASLFADNKARTSSFTIPEYNSGAFYYYINDINSRGFTFGVIPGKVTFQMDFESSGTEMPGRCFHNPIICAPGNDATAPDVQWDDLKVRILLTPVAREGRVYLDKPIIMLGGSPQAQGICKGTFSFLCDGLLGYKGKVKTAVSDALRNELAKPAFQNQLSDIIHERILRISNIDYVKKVTITGREFEITHGQTE